VISIFRRLQRVAEVAQTRYEHAVESSRKRSGAFDHFWRAKERYDEVLAGRLAAAIAYYGFFAVFALAMVVYAVLANYLGNNPALISDVDSFLRDYFPKLDFERLKAASQTIGWVGLAGLLLSGIGWVEAWRSSQRAIWGLEQHPGNMIVRRLVDLGMLVALGVLTGLSLAATGLLENFFTWISGGTRSIWLSSANIGLNVLLNMILATALISGLPRLRISPRRLLPPVVLVGVGITLLNAVGQIVWQRTANNPAYQVVSTTVGVLVYLYLFNQLVLFGAALAATSTHGRVMDLAAGPPPAQAPASPPPPPARGPAAKSTAAPPAKPDAPRSA
jgi:membrane protein